MTDEQWRRFQTSVARVTKDHRTFVLMEVNAAGEASLAGGGELVDQVFLNFAYSQQLAATYKRDLIDPPLNPLKGAFAGLSS